MIVILSVLLSAIKVFVMAFHGTSSSKKKSSWLMLISALKEVVQMSSIDHQTSFALFFQNLKTTNNFSPHVLDLVCYFIFFCNSPTLFYDITMHIV